MNAANWRYDEMKQIGVDFADPSVVARYDARQNSSLAWERENVKQWGIDAGHRVIEYGFGTGALTLAAAERGANVVAVDISVAMLDYARRQAVEAGLADRIEFHHAGFLTYGPTGILADFVVSQFAFHHLPDFWKAVSLDRIFSQFKPGGRFILRDVVFSFPPSEYIAQVEAWIENVCSGSGWDRADPEMHVRDEHSTFAWVLEGLLRRAGFCIDHVDYPTPAYAFYLCSKPETQEMGRGSAAPAR